MSSVWDEGEGLSHLERLEQLLAGFLARDLGLVQLSVALRHLPVAANVLPRPHVETGLHVHLQDACDHVLPPDGQKHTSFTSLVVK